MSGLQGGHSGVDIHLGRGNALKILARVIAELEPSNLVEVQGGSAHNAIPREASAVIAGSVEEVRAEVGAISVAVIEEFGMVEPELLVEVLPASTDLAPLTAASGTALLTLMHEVPHGVLGMSEDLPDLVETSNNLATVRTGANEAEILISSRSSAAAALISTMEALLAIADRVGAQAQAEPGYPGWEPDPDSALLVTATRVYERLFGDEPEVRAVHAGLECGIVGEKIPGMDMISIGPDIRNPHSPFEEISISSTERMLGRFLDGLLEEIAASG